MCAWAKRPLPGGAKNGIVIKDKFARLLEAYESSVGVFFMFIYWRVFGTS